MTPDQLATFLEHNRRDTTEVVERVVNGKIRELKKIVEDHNLRHEAEMADIKPIVVEYQQRVAAREYAKKVGDAVKWGGGIVLTIAAVWALFFKQ